MGTVLSLNNSRGEPYEVSQSEICKRQRLSSSFCEENSRLISSLPDEISIQILARIPRMNYLHLKLVSRSWKAAIMSAELFNLRKELGITEEWLYVLTKVEMISFHGMLWTLFPKDGRGCHQCQLVLLKMNLERV